MEGLKELNSPIAVVAIISVVFGFGMMGLRELFYFLKGVKKTTPTDKLNDTFTQLTVSLKLLNEQMTNAQKHSEREHNEILKGIDRLERRK